MRYWVAVSRSGESEGDDRLKRTAENDRIAIYAPRPKQSFIAIGEWTGGGMNVQSRGEAAVKPLIDSLGFIRDKKQWGAYFRRGFFEITEADFRTIEQAMLG